MTEPQTTLTLDDVERLLKMLAPAPAAPMVMVAPTEPAPVKPGTQTSEFKFAAVAGTLATIMSALYGAGVIPEKGHVAVICGMVALALTSAGYSVSRGMTKKQGGS